tara:strand:- start:591 stop:1205 length:615 start_codon:yes stop_codon:yes gene_type:complete
MEAPKGLILFANTPLGKELASTELKSKFGLGILLSVLVFVGMFWFANILLVISVIIAVNSVLIINAKKTVKIPLAVNLNHPFMESQYVSDSEVMVNFSGKWVDPGNHRLKLAKDSLGGWIVHRQDEDISTLSVWDTSLKESALQKHLSIINQAISLNNAINESNDEFDDARERESQESSLLERNWLPEDEIEVQGPISRIFSSE